MITRLLRFNDLKARDIVRSHAQLARLQKFYGFPRGRMLSPNQRTWTEDEVEAWYASRPEENTGPLRGRAKAKRKAAEAKAAAADNATA
jgi:predicted DNA-binding transcriptional regulator AlpA